jgi:sugar phosphate isomerase/epimerase
LLEPIRTTRRQLLAACAGAVVAAGRKSFAEDSPKKTALGVVIHSYAVRIAADKVRGVKPPFDEANAFLEYCHQRGAGGVQVGLGARDEADAARLRAHAEANGMYLEGTIRLPRDDVDLKRFEAEARTARDAGATVVRTAVLAGRRYETFHTEAEFRRFADQSFHSLSAAVPIVARYGLKLAIENHKDWRVKELVGILERIKSPHVGACVDTGNNIALLDDPYDVVETLAPWAFSTHLKDMVLIDDPLGFRLAEIPLGDGFLDLPRIVGALRKARPELHFILEMITRDPLKVPCLDPGYWVTLCDVPGRDLARTLLLARKSDRHAMKLGVSHLSEEEKLRIEEDNVVRSLAFARAGLGM